MPRWLRLVLGPLPATLLLLPMLLAGGLGGAIALRTALTAPGRSTAERWSDATSNGMFLAWIVAAAVGLMGLWIVVLAESTVTTRRPLARWALTVALLAGVVAAARWLWLMAASRHDYDARTWALWLVMLVGPILLGLYYVILLVRGDPGTGTP
jgi:hypothetical protein